MSRLIWAVAVSLALGVPASAAAATLTDFEDAPLGAHYSGGQIVEFGGQRSLQLGAGTGPLDTKTWTFGGGGWDRIPLPDDHWSGKAFGYSTTVYESFDVYAPDGGQVIFDRQSFTIAPGQWTSIQMRPIAYTLTAKFRGEGMLFDNIRVSGEYLTPAPEPTTWSMMIAGFGLAGAGLRRSRAQRQAPNQI